LGAQHRRRRLYVASGRKVHLSRKARHDFFDIGPKKAQALANSLLETPSVGFSQPSNGWLHVTGETFLIDPPKIGSAVPLGG